MNLVRRISAGALSVLDFGPEKVSVLIAEKKGDVFRVLGGGEAPSAGVADGEVVHPGDASEAVITAVRAAESAAGISVETLYYNLDDAAVEQAVSTGSKTLPGEGEVRAADVAEACHT